MTTITDITSQFSDLPQGMRVYQYDPVSMVCVESKVDAAASNADTVTVRITAGPCDAQLRPVEDMLGTVMLHAERLLVIKSDSPVAIADELAAIHRAMVDEVRVAAEHRAQLAALDMVAN